MDQDHGLPGKSFNLPLAMAFRATCVSGFYQGQDSVQTISLFKVSLQIQSEDETQLYKILESSAAAFSGMCVTDKLCKVVKSINDKLPGDSRGSN